MPVVSRLLIATGSYMNVAAHCRRMSSLGFSDNFGFAYML